MEEEKKESKSVDDPAPHRHSDSRELSNNMAWHQVILSLILHNIPSGLHLYSCSILGVCGCSLNPLDYPNPRKLLRLSGKRKYVNDYL